MSHASRVQTPSQPVIPPVWVDGYAGMTVRQRAVPVQLGTSAGMIVYSSRPHGFGRDAMAAALALAAEASKGLRLVLRIVTLPETEENLRAAMASRTPTDLALGVIIGQERCSYDVALEWLFRASRTRNVSIRDLAAEIVAAADEPHPVRVLFDH
ncbi:hypothetical protein AHiyo4_26780 [Arthrobacter sp. Hiyo4]|nr:hypothetical protein AHiyo4_26780 [Arthrobacter sp. Hiyo4]